MADYSLNFLQLDATTDDEAVSYGKGELSSDVHGAACLRAAEGIVGIDDGAIHAVLLRYHSVGYIGRNGAEDVCSSVNSRPVCTRESVTDAPVIVFCSAYCTESSKRSRAHYREREPMFLRRIQ